MPDWTRSMEQSYEYYTVEPRTLADVERLTNVKSASFTRDNDTDTLGSATIDANNFLGEKYIRGYLKTVQDGITEKHALGTVLVQTPTSSFNGMATTASMDAYTPLKELKENRPPIGYTVRAGKSILTAAHQIIRENTRVPVEDVVSKYKLVTLETAQILSHPRNVTAKVNDTVIFSVKAVGVGLSYQWSWSKGGGWFPVSFPGANTSTVSVPVTSERDGFMYHCTVTDSKGNRAVSEAGTLTIGTRTSYGDPVVPDSEPDYQLILDESADPKLQSNFVANTNDTWLTFVRDLLAVAKYELGLDPTGRILFLPIQDIESLQPVWTYTDDKNSIMLPEITMNHDLYDIPNAVEVIYSYGSVYKRCLVVNDDPNSPVSEQARGRRITYTDTQPSLSGYVTDEQIREYAERLLRTLSTIEYTVSYTHAYCPVRVGDCVRINYAKAGINGIKAKVVSQNIKASIGCQVSEKAVFTTKLWR